MSEANCSESGDNGANLTALLCAKHEPETTCGDCGLDVDQYGNTEDTFENCSYPHCGCAGARNCMAPSGANYGSNTLNLEKGRKALIYEDLDT